MAPVDDAETTKKACKRIYNERDCCEEEEKCKTARLALRQNSIKEISLDITASFKPDAESMEEERDARDTQLRLMPARKWRNRVGQVVAEGRATDIRNRLRRRESIMGLVPEAVRSYIQDRKLYADNEEPCPKK